MFTQGKECNMKLVTLRLLVLSAVCGTFTSAIANEIPSPSPLTLPLISMNSFDYQGGFRISGSNFGDHDQADINFSNGVMTYNSKNNSIFVVSHPYQSRIGEFAIPELVNSGNIADFNEVKQSIQDFAAFYDTDRVDTGIESRFRITGLENYQNKLIVNYVDWYDGHGDETDTSIVFQDSSNLETSKITGPYQLDGKARGAGWLSEIPMPWQTILGGTHVSGAHSGTSIISRLSVGPSAFVIDPEKSFFSKDNGSVTANGLLDFAYPKILRDHTDYPESSTLSTNDILYNKDLNNDLWVMISGASYGFIAPNSRTYVTLGKSGGHESGIGYKIQQEGEEGALCAGPCPVHVDDQYAYYWLWDVNDLIKVKNKELESHEVKPYEYGKFAIPDEIDALGIGGGAFDSVNNMLYVSIPKADTLKDYSVRPVFLAYRFDIKNENVPPVIELDFSTKKSFYFVNIKAKDSHSGIKKESIKVHLVLASEYDKLGEKSFASGIIDCELQTAADLNYAKGLSAYKIPFSLLSKETYVYAIEIEDEVGNKQVVTHRFTH